MSTPLSLPALADALFQALLCHGEIVTIRYAVALAQLVRAHGSHAFTLHGVEYAASSSGVVELLSPTQAAFSAGPYRARVAA